MKIGHYYLNDRSIVAAIKNGDRNALAYLYKTYYSMIKHLVIKNSGSDEEAEDLYQEGILNVYENIVNNKFEIKINDNGNEVKLKTYVYAICYNKWRMELRKKNKSPFNYKVSNEFISVNLAEENSEEMPHINILRNALEQIDERCKEIIKYFYYHKMTHLQIAAKFGYNSDNVAKSTMARCMKNAREIAKLELRQYHK